MPEATKKGIMLAAITAVISGVSIFYNKFIIVKGIDPLIFNIVKNGGVAIILSTLLLSVPRKQLTSIPVKKWKSLFLIGLIGGSIPFVLYFAGLRTVSAINANFIHKTLFLWVTAMAIPILKERLSSWQIVGYLLVAWSNLFIGGFSGFRASQGELMILVATLLWSVEYILAKRLLTNTDSSLVAWGRMAFGSLILVVIALWQGKLGGLLTLKPDQFLPIVGSILLLTGYVLTWYQALKLAPATLVTSVLILSTPVTNLLTAVFITHTLPQPQLMSAVVTTIGIIFIAMLLPKLKKPQAPLLPRETS